MRTYQAVLAVTAMTFLACGGETSVGPEEVDATSSALSAAVPIYGDALAPGWADWSWATHTLANTAPVAAGTRSIAVSFGPWTALYFSTAGVSTAGRSTLGLQVNGGAAGGATILVRALVDGRWTAGVALGSSCAGGSIPAGRWASCTVPLAALAPAGGTLTGLAFQEGSGRTLPTVYLDELGLDVQSATPISVAVAPPAASLTTGETQVFTATVSGTTSTGVTWTVQEGPAGGSITPSGTYTAPATPGTYHVVATSQADTTKSAAATATVAAPACAPETDAAFCARVGATCGSASGTDSCGQPRTATCGAPCPTAGKESWVWVYTDWANVLAAITANRAAFTHVSPTFYTVNYAYRSGVAFYSTCPNVSSCTGNSTNGFGGMTTRQFAAKVKALGLKVVPLVYGGSANGGTDAGVQSILDNTNGAGDAFVSAMTAEAVINGYDGYNLDWEVGRTIGGTYADKLVAFVDKFKAALAAHGMSLSLDAIVSNVNGTWCSGNSGFIDLQKLGASSIDRIIIEDYVSTLGTPTTTCQNVVLSTSRPARCDFTFTGELDMMCAPNLPVEKAVIGLMADPTATNPIAGTALSTLESHGFTRVAVWPQAPFMNPSGLQPAGTTWYALLQGFLAR